MIENTAVPPFTGSLDAKVPSENVVLSHYMADISRWVVASEAYDGAVFFGTGATEALARRAAGLRTLAHLENRTAGAVDRQTPNDTKFAREELALALKELSRMITTTNLPLPEPANKDVVLIELRAARDGLRAGANRSILARLAIPVLTFVALAFAEGTIGALAEKCLDALSELLSG